jgi:hypothetical protein
MAPKRAGAGAKGIGFLAGCIKENILFLLFLSLLVWAVTPWTLIRLAILISIRNHSCRSTGSPINSLICKFTILFPNLPCRQ